jgi:hypothetical protein
MNLAKRNKFNVCNATEKTTISTCLDGKRRKHSSRKTKPEKAPKAIVWPYEQSYAPDETR